MDPSGISANPMRRSSFIHILITMGLLAGCTPPPITSTAPSPQPISTETAIPATASPAWILAGSDLDLQEIPEGLLLIGTFENSTGSSIADIKLDVQLVDEGGETVLQMPLRPVPSFLAAGETAGFAVVFPSPGRPVTPSVQVQAYEEVRGNNARVSVEILDVRPGIDGQTYVLGEVFNQSMSYARLDGLLLLPADARDGIGAARLIPGNQGLAPRATVFFLASVVGMIPENGWRTFIDASSSGIPDSPDLVLTQPITLHFTEQGRPFHIAQIQNQGSLPRWIGGQLALFADETLISLSEITSPFPLQPQEIRVVSIKTYPGLPADALPSPGAMATWQPELQIDAFRSRPALDATLDLKIEVAQFEAIGGLIFIRGNLTNEHPAPVMNPSVLVVSRNQTGRVLDSAWDTPAADLAAGASVSFELTLLLPAGATAEMSEYDIQGQGLAGRAE